MGLRGAFFINGDISIHALVKRATRLHRVGVPCRPYFNPRPRKEGDNRPDSACVGKSNFNPRPRKEGDLVATNLCWLAYISIHALVKRATIVASSATGGRNYFNPRPRKEGDVQYEKKIFHNQYFNPRPRKEGDQEGDDWKHPYDIISIHALVKRATAQQYEAQLTRVISIHALVKRATIRQQIHRKAWIISIHALVKRATEGKF